MILDTPTLVDLEIDELHPATDNVRTKLTDLDGLAASIKAVGILEPLVVTPNGDGYTIVAGARRHAASIKAGLTTVPCVIRNEMSTAERVEAMVIENLQREGLTPLEEADAYQRLVDLEWSQRQIAERVGRNQSHVSKRLTLTKLPDIARAALTDGRITIDVAVELTKLDEKDQKRLLQPGRPVSEWSVENAVKEAKTRRRREKLAKPYIAKGLKYLARPDFMKWTECTEAKATAFWFGWNDQVTFVKAKPKPKPSGSTSDGGRQQPDDLSVINDSERHAARAQVLAGELPQSVMLEILTDYVRDQVEAGTLQQLGLVDDDANLTWQETQDLVTEYCSRGLDQCLRALMANELHRWEFSMRWPRPDEHGRYLQLLIDHGGYTPTDAEQALLAQHAAKGDTP